MASPGLPTPDTLPLAAQVAQLVVVRASGTLFDHQRRYPQWEAPQADLQRYVQELGIGGVIWLGGTAAELGLRTQQVQGWAEIPLFMAADVEEGVGQRFAGATQFPPPLALGAIAQTDLDQACTYAEAMGAATAQEAIALGLNWLLAPVVDVNNNADNPVINVRAFGQTPHRVQALTQAFIAGAQRHPVLTAAKHFPGHGDTAVDSHLQLPIVSHDRDRLAQIEFPPFHSAIAAGVDAVMTAHLQVPRPRPRPPSHPLALHADGGAAARLGL
jgi:beta-glucosidase